MRVLVLSNEVWNDRINGNNVTSNWFDGMGVDIANIYCSPGIPLNKCCNEYFQITDMMMLKSIINNKGAGKKISVSEFEISGKNSAEEEPKKLYSFLKSISGCFLRFIRELLWCSGSYDIDSLKSFIDGFQPDIIFSERMASLKMLRLEKTVLQLCDAPIAAFTGDDEYSFRQLYISPFFWINRIMVRYKLKEMTNKYEIYYMFSEEQKKDYENRFNCKCKILHKGVDLSHINTDYLPHNPIRLVYAGKLYCNRWKALAEIVKIIKYINKNSKKLYLEIYTTDKPTKAQKRKLDDKVNSIIKDPVSENELKEIYRNSDVAVHVESKDVRNRLLTRLSFSTKIVDCIGSGCAILAYCWEQQSGWLYLKRENAAMCVSEYISLKSTLENLVNNPEMVKEYSKKSYECAVRNHNKEMIQYSLLEDFERIVESRV